MNAGGRSGAEGVIQFDARHTQADLPPHHAPLAAALAAWRRPLRHLGWLGQEEGRYGGYGFGNLSVRVPASLCGAEGPGRSAFLITGSQSGSRETLPLDGFALVERYDLAGHRLWSRGRVAASSESLTHAALYDCSPRVGAVFHVHAPEPWRDRQRLGLPETPGDVPYGTPEMAAAVAGAWRRTGDAGRGAPSGVAAMAGHEDGVLAWGPDPAAAGRALLVACGWWG